MKLLLIISLFSLSLQASDMVSEFQNLLQNKLGFSGQVEVVAVEDQGNDLFLVTVDVTSYGETRDNWCLVSRTDIIRCRENWFYR